MKQRDIDARPPVRARTRAQVLPVTLASCCVLAVVGSVAYLTARALTPPDPAVTTLTDVRPIAPAVEKLRTPRPAATKAPAARQAGVPVAHPGRAPTSPAAGAARSQPVWDADPEPVVVYKSADMSDAEFAAWQRRKAAREGRFPAHPMGRADPANVDDPRNPRASDLSPPSPETLRLIERANR
jgi:hypothetical protein